MSEKNEWQPVLIIPNIEVKKAFESTYIAIVPENDSRVQYYYKDNKKIADVLKFKDYTGKERHISLVLFKKNIPDNFRTPEAIASFRNILAISCILKSRIEKALNYPAPLQISYSNYFDFYPILIAEDGRLLLTNSPANYGLNFPKELVPGQTNPALIETEFNYDSILYEKLFECWKQYFEDNKNDKKHRALFNSLEIAFHACSLPVNNLQSIYDYGVQAALWISAFDVLVYPNNSYANQEYVIEHIEKYNFMTNELNYKRFYYFKDKKKNKNFVSFPSKLYNQLYVNRNIFIHGDEIPNPVFKYIRSGHKEINILMTAAPLYNLAIIRSLGIDSDTSTDIGEMVMTHFYLQRIEDVFIRFLNM